LLAVKATRYPGQELRWDAANYRFTNHDKANNEILSAITAKDSPRGGGVIMALPFRAAR